MWGFKDGWFVEIKEKPPILDIHNDNFLQEKVNAAYGEMHRADGDLIQAIRLLNEVISHTQFKEACMAIEPKKYVGDAYYGKALYYFKEGVGSRHACMSPFFIEADFNLNQIANPSVPHLILHAKVLFKMNTFDAGLKKIEQAEAQLDEKDTVHGAPRTIAKWKSKIQRMKYNYRCKMDAETTSSVDLLVEGLGRALATSKIKQSIAKGATPFKAAENVLAKQPSITPALNLQNTQDVKIISTTPISTSVTQKRYRK